MSLTGAATPSDDRLPSLLDAALEFAYEHDVDRLLSRLVERTREIAGANYAALGVYDVSGQISTFVYRGVDDASAQHIGAYPEGRGLLGDVIVADAPIRVGDLAADPRAFGFPPGHPAMRSFLGVPVRSGSRRHGNLYVTDKASGPFDEADEKLIVALASFAAAAIDNALLVDAERERAESLAQLAAAQARARAQQDALERVIQAQEAERARVARDLHDQIGQSLTSILLALGVLDSLDPGSEEARLRSGELRELVVSSLDDVRQLAFELRPTILDDIGLVAALDRLTTSYSSARSVKVELAVDGLDDLRRLPAELETVIYRIVQEALTNVVRHARAQHAAVTVRRDDRAVVVDVADDGIGFDTGAVASSLGIAGMAERAALARATFALQSEPGAGTSVHMEVSVG
ncbi:MAG: GAF domain-containing sensor histidine kinase [Actinobacteria bacterium]|nr:GAF domain-containing sensor histidine kinase [Actinomycetota bacterium]